MPTLDIFNDDAFSVVSLTAKVNTMPYVPSQIAASGLFESDGVSTTIVEIEEMDGSLSLIEPSERGGNGETVDNDKRNLVPFKVDHFQRDDSILADEVQNVRAFGTESEVDSVMDVVERKTGRHLRDADATIEHQQIGAMKGIVLSKSGAVRVNLFTRFEIDPPADLELALDDPAANLRGACLDFRLGVEDDLEATTYSGLHVYCGDDFYKKLITHKKVEDTYLATIAAAELRGLPTDDKFEFGNITWERYRTGKKAKASNGATAFIGSTEARMVVKGVPGLFITRYAPADYEDTVNTKGLPRYARQWGRQDGKGRHLQIQTNPISLCTQPKTLRRIVIGA
jgi:hypothetical protein